MKRLIDLKLIEWNKKDDSLPIILFGARQVGKTYSVLNFANTFYKDKYIYINFMSNKDYLERLSNVTTPDVIISEIRNLSKININEDYLLIFDEIQEIPSLKTALKLFVDLNYKYKIICTGSYLGNSFKENNEWPFPVGKVEIWNMYPLNFKEYLLNKKYEKYIDVIQEATNSLKPIPKDIHKLIIDELHNFMFIGGMPQVLDAYLNNSNQQEINQIKQSLLDSYRLDVTRMISNKQDIGKCLTIYDNIQRFLAKKNKKFIMSSIDKSARYDSYQLAIQNLLESKLIYKVENLNKYCVPLNLSSNPSEFKLYFNDCGFIPLVFNLDLNMFKDNDNNIYPNVKGAIAENFIISELQNQTNSKYQYYYSWHGNQNESTKKNYEFNNSNTCYELDLCIENQEAKIIPIEIKYGKMFSTNSLKRIIETNKPPYGIIFSSNNINYDTQANVFELPLYCISFLDLSLNRIKLK